MSSEAITRNDLTAILDDVIPKSANKISYVDNISTLFNTNWVCPESGIMVMMLGMNTSGGTAYCYIKDVTTNVLCGLINNPANGYYHTASFPVIKGHEYSAYSKTGISNFNAYYYKFSFVNQPSGYYRGYVSTSAPTSADGENGDIWIKYSV